MEESLLTLGIKQTAILVRNPVLTGWINMGRGIVTWKELEETTFRPKDITMPKKCFPSWTDWFPVGRMGFYLGKNWWKILANKLHLLIYYIIKIVVKGGKGNDNRN